MAWKNASQETERSKISRRSLFSSSMKIINLPIFNKDALLQEYKLARKTEFKPGDDVGIYYLDADRLQIMFKEHFELYGVKAKILRGWAHFMVKGASRNTHKHTDMTGLYYLRIPKGSGQLIINDTGEVITPAEDDFFMFEPMVAHEITPHDNEEERWAIAFECTLEDTITTAIPVEEPTPQHPKNPVKVGKDVKWLAVNN